MDTIFLTDTGKKRAHNEDSGGVLKKDTHLLAVVADGMGGHQAGELASQMAVTYLDEQWQLLNEELSPSNAEKWLTETLQNANTHLYEYAQQNPECLGMGTTIATAICTEHSITIAHIGDSRIYLLNKNGFSLLTEDHSLVNELVKNGQISLDEAENHPRKHMLLRALGTEETTSIDIRTLNWEAEDVVLLCSDGLTNKVSEKVIEEVIRSDQSLVKKANELIRLANVAGGDDNITVILVKKKLSERRRNGEHG